MGAAIAAGVIALAGTAYSAYASNKASKQASGALNNMQQVEYGKAPPPVTVNYEDVLRGVIGQNYQNLPMNMATANKVNLFNTNQAVRDYGIIQPYFKQNQELIGRNAASFARGELPGDVVGSIGRAAASRGFQNGLVGSGGYNPALGNLNLRNLGLTSLDLSKFGTQLAQSTNASAASMAPGLFDLQGQMISPALAIASKQFNANAINQVNALNTGIGNQQESDNTNLINNIIAQQAQIDLQRQLNNAKAVQSASSTVAGLAGGGAFGGGGGAAGGMGAGSAYGGWQSSAAGAGGRALV